MSIQKSEWEQSYRNRDNFVFYPHEEVVRFVSKHIRKRTGLEEFKDVAAMSRTPRILDLGCGIGRHVIYCHEMGLDAYGIDLSEVAIGVALKWAAQKGIAAPDQKIKQGDVRKLPWPDGYFDFAVSHGVLDSMQLEVASTACSELARVMTAGGLFYCDLISGDDSSHAREFCGEETMTAPHERGTIQSYFNFQKINSMIGGLFEIAECVLLRREEVMTGNYISRYHLVLRKA